MTSSPLVLVGIVCSLLFVLGDANGFQKPAQHELPNSDQRKPQAQTALHRKNAEAKNHLRKGLPKAQVEFDEIVGSPKLISSPDGFLSGKKANGRGISAKTSADYPANEPHRATKAFLKEHHALFGHGPEVLVNAKIKRDFVTPHNGMRTVVWEQQLNDISVFEGLLISHTTKNEELVNISSHFLPDQAQAARNGARNQLEQNGEPRISAQAAISIAVENIGEKIGTHEIESMDTQAQGAERRQKFKSARPSGETETRLVWLPMNAKEMRLCWEIILTSHARGEMFRLLVDAQTGEVLLRRCLTNYISNASYRVYTSDSPSPFSPGHSTPISTPPPLVPRVLVVTNAFNTNASPNGWINDGGNETTGNNVDAHLDRDNNNVADTPRPQGSPSRVFDFPMDLTQAPGTYTNASVVQLFYLCNWYHDKLYELGFIEAAGNFQVSNFGRGGLGNDPVQADAQDGGGFNNANFSTPPDGSSPRMQMYIFDGPTPDIDGDFDAEIVFHEYTHGLSNRRVGGGVGISTLQSAGMGEGWSDFYALCLLAEPGDDVNGNYAAGGYATSQLGGLTQNYYFGIRRYPYSTDLTKNPLTFKDIDPSQADIHAGIPENPVIGGGGAAEVHNQGEVWCVALWEVRARLINKHGFAIGNQLTLQLVTDGMNLSPANPNFLQARDAIIQADQVATGGANRGELWAGFAKRGLGFFAFSPSSSTTTGVIESFALPDDLLIVPQTFFTAVGPVGGPFIPSSQLFTLTNTGTNTIFWNVGATATWITLSQTSGTLTPGEPSTTVTANLNSTANVLPAGIYTETVRFTNLTSGISQTRQFALNIGQPDYFTEAFDSGGNDLDNQMFTFTPDDSASFYFACRQPAVSFPTDPIGGTSVSLTDDSFATVTLASTTRVRIYGSSNNVFYIGSNGYITLGSGDSNLDASLETHFNRPRISALFDDLFPSTGQVTWKQMSNRVAVTFANVREFGTSNTNNFQIEMFFDGVIRITYLRIDVQTGLAGLSRGTGIPSGFTESDFSIYGNCATRLTLVLPESATEGADLLAGQGSVRISSPISSNLTVNLASSDTTELIVPTSIVISAGETNANFDVTIVNDSELDGTQRSAVTASTTGFANATRSMTIFDNESATLSVNIPASAIEGSSNLVGTVTVSAPPDDNVLVNLSSSDISEAQVSSFAIIPAGQTSAVFNLTAVDDTQIDGSQISTITAHVTNWTAGMATITVDDNESTNLVVLLPRKAIESNGTLTNAGLVRISGTLTSNLVLSLASDDTSELMVPTTVTLLAGKTSAAFNLTVVNDVLLDGTQNVSVAASAIGFSNGTQSMLIVDDESPPVPMNPFPPHHSTNNLVNVDLSWIPLGGEGAERISNGGFESGDFSGWTKTTSGLGDFMINTGTNDPASPDGPTAPYEGAFSAFGTQVGPGLHLMYRDVVIPTNFSLVTLNWADRIRNFYTSFATNQQFRVEARTTANVTLAVLFSTQPGDPVMGDWVERTVDLSSYKGQTIRFAFIVDPSLYFLDVHLDNVSVRVASPPTPIYDVYFGTFSNPNTNQFLGTTTNNSWNLPILSPFTTYYWKIVGRRTGETEGPIWQFSTGPAGISIDDAGILEEVLGKNNNLLFNVRLSSPARSDTITVNYATADGTASYTTDYVPTNGVVTFAPGQTNKTISVAVKGDALHELAETLFVNLSTPTNGLLLDAQAVGAITNDDPFLAPITNRTVNEGTLLTFTALATSASMISTQSITDFEIFTNGTPNGTVLFRDPRNSSSTIQYLNTTPSRSSVTNVFPLPHAGERALVASWSFIDSSNAWLRLTTFNTTNLPNPTIDIRQSLRFDIYSDKALRAGLGLRETNTMANIGANGGINGLIEFVGVSSKIGTTPVPDRLISPSNWTTLTFNIPTEPVSIFTGNGFLESTTGKGVLEHLALKSVGGVGTYNIFLDNFAVLTGRAITYSLSNAPLGAVINPTNGIFIWTPSEAQGPGVYTIIVRASESGGETDDKTFSITVNEVNTPPSLPPVVNATITEKDFFMFTANGTDSDLPTNALSYSLVGAPPGANIDSASGVFSWTPTEIQGPTTNTIQVLVTDNGLPNLSTNRTFTITVLENNSAPVLSAITNQIIVEGNQLLITNVFSDSDLPTNNLTFALEPGAPAGAVVDPATGIFSWTPTEAQGPNTNIISIRVTDNGFPILGSTQTFQVGV
ncbi:MAG: M36 family metallopeptidase, partial [Verrucomicrobiota bacterium]